MDGTKKYALAHYDRMRCWVAEQNLTDSPNMKEMFLAIGENALGGFCPYCRNFTGANCSLYGIDCELLVNGQCCDGVWNNMMCADTWFEWLVWCDAIIKFIKEKG
ncbi:MAG: hypothetical protein GY853_05870 [PVC group bacterium]|nr:hypothetical protein [PVC group bacterium]